MPLSKSPFCQFIPLHHLVPNEEYERSFIRCSEYDECPRARYIFNPYSTTTCSIRKLQYLEKYQRVTKIDVELFRFLFGMSFLTNDMRIDREKIRLGCMTLESDCKFDVQPKERPNLKVLKSTVTMQMQVPSLKNMI